MLVAAVLDAQQRARAGLACVGSATRPRRDSDRLRRSHRDRRPARSRCTVGSAAIDARASARRARRRSPSRREREPARCAAPRARTCWRRSASASAVTAQLLNTATSASSGALDDLAALPPRPSRGPLRCRTGWRDSRRCAGTPSRREAAGDRRRRWRAAGRAARSGTRFPASRRPLFTQMRPPCASTTSLQKARPSPELRTRGMCGVFTCSNFRKMMSWYSGGMPTPLSATVNSVPVAVAARAERARVTARAECVSAF